MPQPLLIGLIAGLFALAAAVLGLIGVLVTTKVNFKLGKRTGDTQQQTADTARIEQLVEETQKLRAEITQLWDANRELRHAFELSDMRHEGERNKWDAEKRALTDRSASELRLLTAQNEGMHTENADLRKQLADTAKKLGRGQAELDKALLCQAQAEGGLVQAQRTITEKVCGLEQAGAPIVEQAGYPTPAEGSDHA